MKKIQMVELWRDLTAVVKMYLWLLRYSQACEHGKRVMIGKMSVSRAMYYDHCLATFLAQCSLATSWRFCQTVEDLRVGQAIFIPQNVLALLANARWAMKKYRHTEGVVSDIDGSLTVRKYDKLYVVSEIMDFALIQGFDVITPDATIEAQRSAAYVAIKYHDDNDIIVSFIETVYYEGDKTIRFDTYNNKKVINRAA
jgi:hypothetical protein